NKPNTDQRTNLFNHTYFHTILQNQLTQPHTQRTPLSLPLIHIHHFKKYNHPFPHLQPHTLLPFFPQFLIQPTHNTTLTPFPYPPQQFTFLIPPIHLHQPYTFINNLPKHLNHTPFQPLHLFPHPSLSFSPPLPPYHLHIYNNSHLLHQPHQPLY
ncbi:diguanylate cyclase domain-containing protein, partial [Paenibacillus xylanexedens]|uniref:diguanylate cyclase domain-containing protein n=1 Tax=Paenibacillus xylanexedens TaxID=528191 RepID=UPI00119D7365